MIETPNANGEQQQPPQFDPVQKLKDLGVDFNKIPEDGQFSLLIMKSPTMGLCLHGNCANDAVITLGLLERARDFFDKFFTTQDMMARRSAEEKQILQAQILGGFGAQRQ